MCLSQLESNTKPYLLAVLVLASVLAGCIVQPSRNNPPPYKDKTFVVDPGYRQTMTIVSRGKGTILEGYFVTEGGNNDINFRIQTPKGAYLEDVVQTRGRHDFYYALSEEGPYTLIFDNSYSIFTGKHVSLMYRAY